jgi:hypothetical protein
MKKLILALAIATSALSAMPAQATVLVPGSQLQPTQAIPAGTEGTQQAVTSGPALALTFSAIFNQAVYRNSGGTLDFYYQVIRTGAGSVSSEEIRSFTVSNFAGYTVDAFTRGGDFDGAGPFVAPNNPTLSDGTPSGSTTTFGRSLSGAVLTTEFGLNGLTGTENSTTYVFRTNATQFDLLGTYGIIDGSTASGLAYRPIGAPAVPEPSTWAFMLVGFGAIGYSMRSRRAGYRMAQAV